MRESSFRCCGGEADVPGVLGYSLDDFTALSRPWVVETSGVRGGVKSNLRVQLIWRQRCDRQNISL
jgi:hypothetical protein